MLGQPILWWIADDFIPCLPFLNLSWPDPSTRRPWFDRNDLQVPKPKLVINLLKSLGTQQWYEGISNAGANGAKPDGSLIIKGIVKNALPWLDDKEMMDGYGRSFRITT